MEGGCIGLASIASVSSDSRRQDDDFEILSYQAKLGGIGAIVRMQQRKLNRIYNRPQYGTVACSIYFHILIESDNDNGEELTSVLILHGCSSLIRSRSPRFSRPQTITRSQKGIIRRN